MPSARASATRCSSPPDNSLVAAVRGAQVNRSQHCGHARGRNVRLFGLDAEQHERQQHLLRDVSAQDMERLEYEADVRAAPSESLLVISSPRSCPRARCGRHRPESRRRSGEQG